LRSHSIGFIENIGPDYDDIVQPPMLGEAQPALQNEEADHELGGTIVASSIIEQRSEGDD